MARTLSRDNYRGNIVVENSRLGLFKKSFIPRGSTLPNSLPKDIRRIPKLGTFKKELRKWIMDNINTFERVNLLVRLIIILQTKTL